MKNIRDDQDTTKAERTPRNLLDYIKEQSLNDEFLLLLAKHSKNIGKIINNDIDIAEVRNAKFIIGINDFSKSLTEIANLCEKIDNEYRTRQANIDKSRALLSIYNSEELISRVGIFYIEARRYDKYFCARNFLPTVNGRIIFLGLFFPPFRYSDELTNEENIFNLFASFNLHDNFL